MRIWRLKIEWLLKPKLKTQYMGVVCDVCGIKVKGASKGHHLIDCHPEYACRAIRTGSSPLFTYLAYKCLTCGKSMSGVASMVRHYREDHPEKLKQ